MAIVATRGTITLSQGLPVEVVITRCVNSALVFCPLAVFRDCHATLNTSAARQPYSEAAGMIALRKPASWRVVLAAAAAFAAMVYLLGPTTVSKARVLLRPGVLKQPPYARRRDPPVVGCPADQASHASWLTRQVAREKACMLLLARDKDLEELKHTLANFEETFNAKFRYPYVFLNDEPYSEAFQQGVRQSLPAGAVVEFGTIPTEHWSIPPWLDKKVVRERFKKMGEEDIQYADREGYHHMCRYYSGLFALHPLLEKYNYYWRLEPGVRFYCELQYDPFLYMAQYKKVYGWVITIVESWNTIPTLFDSILEWRDMLEKANSGLGKFSQQLQLANYNKKGELWDFFLKNPAQNIWGRRKEKEDYNLCHFWTNFEIGDLRFFRGQEYQSLFNYLDRKGGFYLERWGDAPIRSLAVGLIAGFDAVHYFEDIAYKHDWFLHKPLSKGIGCKCNAEPFAEWIRDVDNNEWYSCLPKWKALDRL